MHKSLLCTSILMTIAAAGCGGGGGGSSPSGATGVVRPFVTFEQVQAGETVEADGISQSAALTMDDVGNVVSLEPNGGDSAGRVRLSYGAAMELSGLDVATAHSQSAWSGSTQISCDALSCDAANPRAAGLLVNGPGLGWNYQSFGYWIGETGPLTAAVDAVSFGTPTQFDAIPVSGTASYSGVAAGLYVDEIGWPSDYAASMSATADFGAARSVSFSTTRSMILPLGAEDVIATPELDFAGTLSISAQSNRFSGAVSTLDPSAGLSGTATGRFYGPAAQEIGGVFELMGGGPKGLVGGFGGSR